MSWDDFYNSFKKAAGKAADKINQTADLATLQVKLSLAEHKLEEAYAEFGKVAYAHFSSEESQVDGITAAMTVVETAQKNVQDLQNRIDEAKQKDTSADA